MIGLVDVPAVNRSSFVSFSRLEQGEVVEVCPLNSSIRLLLLRAEEKHQRAEQSDDSLEEDNQQQTVDSLSDGENDEFFFGTTSLKESE